MVETFTEYEYPMDGELDKIIEFVAERIQTLLENASKFDKNLVTTR